MERATPAAISEDLRRYFYGLSAQFTAVLDAAWHGRIHFCTAEDQFQVVDALVLPILRPDPEESLRASGLAGGTEELIAAFAGPVLDERLERFAATTPVEAARKSAAIAAAQRAGGS